MKRKHHLRADTTENLFGSPSVKTVPNAVEIRPVRIEFDGGTPCNIPRLGYGDGYGSYRIDQQEIRRLEFQTPMSANVAEITTLTRAIEEVARTHNPQNTRLDIYGDSQIALNRCRFPVKAKMAVSNPTFAAACQALHAACAQFAEVETHWRGRAASVELFGH